MKNLDVLAKDTFYRVTTQLRDAVIEIAGEIRQKMEELEMPEIRFSEFSIRVVHVQANSGACTEYLGFIPNDSDKESLEDENYYCYANDYNCQIKPVSKTHLIEFANNLQAILTAISDWEKEQTERAESSEFWDFYKAYTKVNK